jgi:hypothetical protein
MPIKSNPPSSRVKVLLTIATCALLAATGLAAALGARRHSTRAATSHSQLLPAAVGPAQIVRFTVYDAGIFPREARASAGLVALQLEDMSGGSAELVVANESLQPVGQVVRQPHRQRADTHILLVPGRYTVYDPNRPTNQVTLVVEP